MIEVKCLYFKLLSNGMKWLLVTIILFLINMSTSENKNHRSVSFAPRENRQMTILSRQEVQWKKTSKIKTSPSATFGKSGRNSQQKKLLPGPGSYELNKTTFQKGFVAFKGNKRIRFNTDSPGPGAYQPKPLFSSKKFSFEKYQTNQKMQSRPSPASYDFQFDRTNGMSFTKQQRNLTPQKQKLLLPGPGKYESAKGFTHKNEFSFTKTKKFFESQQQSQEKDLNPGPGAYDLGKSRNLIKSTKFAKAIRNFLEDDKRPGPGSYELDRSTLLALGGTISAEKRCFNYTSQVPGPGNYNAVPIDSIKKKQGGFIISRSRQNSNQNLKNLPGPGAYFRQKISSDKIVGGVIGKDSRSNRKQIIVSNLANTTNILFNKQTKEDYSSNDALKQHSFQVSNQNYNNVFQQLTVNPKNNVLAQI